MSSQPRPFPEAIELTDDETVLQIQWDDGTSGRHRLAVLRADCPCAQCKGHSPEGSLNLKPEQFPDIRLLELAPVGSYAYTIVWSDGHNTGIYTLDALYERASSA